MSIEADATEIKNTVVKDKGQFIASSEKWLRDLGVFTDATAQAFLASLYQAIYWIDDFDITIDQNELKIELTLKFSLVGYVFGRKRVHKEKALQIAKEFFPYYTTQVSITRA